jgi:prepilin-type N-terminal cleavage/methylation domain-containing protein
MCHNEQPKAGRPGFTLIELLVVTVIVGILAAIAVVGYERITQRAYRATVQADMREVVVKQEVYYELNHTYATLAQIADFAPSAGVTLSVTHADNAGLALTGDHAGLPGSCGIYRGTVPPGSAGPATLPDQIMCD